MMGLVQQSALWDFQDQIWISNVGDDAHGKVVRPVLRGCVVKEESAAAGVSEYEASRS